MCQPFILGQCEGLLLILQDVAAISIKPPLTILCPQWPLVSQPYFAVWFVVLCHPQRNITCFFHEAISSWGLAVWVTWQYLINIIKTQSYKFGFQNTCEVLGFWGWTDLGLIPAMPLVISKSGQVLKPVNTSLFSSIKWEMTPTHGLLWWHSCSWGSRQELGMFRHWGFGHAAMVEDIWMLCIVGQQKADMIRSCAWAAPRWFTNM